MEEQAKTTKVVNKKNLRQKLQEARMLLKDENITKSGKNSFLGSAYYTLSDIQAAITKVCNTVGICPVITYTRELATLTLYNFDGDDTLAFTSPLAEASKDAKKSEMQEWGSILTYSRRQLLLNVFEIVEEEQTEDDDLSRHDILMVKTRIERTMTSLLKKGLNFEDIIREIGIKDEKTYNQYLNFCNSLNTMEKNMNVLLNK